jgi:hypothetical protein
MSHQLPSSGYSFTHTHVFVRTHRTDKADHLTPFASHVFFLFPRTAKTALGMYAPRLYILLEV